MRIPSGVTDQYLYFVAVDSADLITRKTGLSSFTVYRARNGAAAAAYTTPTVAQVSSANMPGVYSLLLDEDMTIGSGNDSEEVVLHITQASMAPVTIKFELYRNVVTAGETLTVASGIGDADVEKWLGQVVAAVTVNGVPEVDVTHWRGTAAAAPTVAGVPAVEVIDIAAAGQTDIRSAVGLASANLDTQLTAIDDYLDTEIAALTTATTAASIRAAVGLASANLDTQLDALPTNAELATSQAAADDATLAAIAALSIPTAAAIADAVWDEDATAHQTQGTFGQAIGDPAADADSIWALVNTNLNATVSSRLASASYTAPLDAAGTRTAVGLASANLDTQIGTLATAANLAMVAGYIDTEIGTLQTSVDDIPTNAELATALAAADDAVLAAIAALNNLSAAQVNAEVVDALATDTYAEPGQGTPGATISLATKINYLYAALRNKSTVTATEHKIFADDGTTVIVKRTLSDDATTFSSTELATGP